MSLVLGASLTFAWFFEDEHTSAASAVLDRIVDTGAIVPALWRIEVLNAFQMAIRRKRIDSGFRDTALARLSALPIAVDPDSDTHVWATTLRFADRFPLTAYDAVYLELAQRRSLPLATLDRDLLQAAATLGVTLLATD